MTKFNRTAATPAGHRLYSSKETIARIRPPAVEQVEGPFPVRRQGDDWVRIASVPRQEEMDYWLGATKARSKPPGRSIPRPNDGPPPGWLERRDAAGHATSSRGVSRIEWALVKSQSPLVATLRQVKELLRPVVQDVNDVALAADNDNAGFGAERKHDQSNILPSVPMVLAAHEAGEMIGHTFCRVGGKEWHLIGSTDHKRCLTGLVFVDGQMVAYGNEKGRKKAPRYLDGKVTVWRPDNKSETAKHMLAQSAENASYLRLGSANDNIAVANGYGRLAGVSEPIGIGDGKTSAPQHYVLAELERDDPLERLDLEDVEIVEEVLADAPYTRIAQERGYAPSSAHKTGKRLVETALQRISGKLAA